MTGRGVDQIQRHPSSPGLHEAFVEDAVEYVKLAEEASGPIPRRVDPAYIWGDALAEWRRMAPDVRLANLETSVTRSSSYEPAKGIHYRMHPDNVACLTAAGFDVCVLANNHTLDYGRTGLVETLEALHGAGMKTAGGGQDVEEAQRVAICPLAHGGRVLVGACAHGSSGVPPDWAARPHVPGIDLLPDLSDDTARAVAVRVTAGKRRGDVAVLSVHWGDNWGWEVPPDHVEFAHRLVDHGVDLVYGHSSHHARPIEVYRGKLVLYGCGDFIDDYEGISGYEEFRGDLVLMFFPTIERETGRLARLELTPLRVRRLRLERASNDDADWLCQTLDRISTSYGVRVSRRPDGTLRVRFEGT
jgi:poly-gamma-glutamate synthesis protein (capsule biosynthesis protein)